MDAEAVYSRYRELQAYVGWTAADAGLVRDLGPRLAPWFPELIDDFYAEIGRHPEARRTITGGDAQVARLKATLLAWLVELFSGRYDASYVERRWRVGRRHVEIGLAQVYINAALSRLRGGLMRALRADRGAATDRLDAAAAALNRLLDLDLAIIEQAYQAEHTAQLRRLEQARIDRQKESSEAAFRQLVESADCLIAIARPDRRLLYLSPFGERLIGRGLEELRGRDAIARLVPAARRRGVVERARDVLGGAATQGFECPIRRRDGSTRDVVWNARLLADYEGSAAILVVGHDITERERARQRALQSERLAAIGEMVAGLAHESRNALQRSQACLERLAWTVGDRPDAMDLIARAQKAQDDLARHYEDVRSYAAPIVLERGACDLAAVWREAWDGLEPARRGRAAALREAIPGDGVRLEADAFRLRQLFANLFDNALAACPDPVEVEVGAARAELDGAPAWRIAVRDNGPGFDPRCRDRLFQPFSTTKAHGTGLGLAIARRIVEAHGGRIGAGAGPGAEIVLLLPEGQP
jgi:PAS domain S-box-containing protein